jgi:hypothetical protein
LKRDTKITLAIMAGGLVTLGLAAYVAVEGYHTTPPCDPATAAGAIDAGDRCQHHDGSNGGGNHGASGYSGSREQTSISSSEASARGGFGEAGGHASGAGE